MSWWNRNFPDVPGRRQRLKVNSRIWKREAERFRKYREKRHDYEVIGSLEHEYVPKGTGTLHKTPAYKARALKRMHFKNLNKKIRGKHWIPGRYRAWYSLTRRNILKIGNYKAIGILPLKGRAPEFLMPGDEFIILLNVIERPQHEVWNRDREQYDIEDEFFPQSKPPVKEKIPKRWQRHKLRKLRRSKRNVRVYDRNELKRNSRDY